MTDLMMLLPEIALTVAMLVVFLVGLFKTDRTLTSALVLVGALIVMYLTTTTGYGIAYSGMIKVDALSVSFKMVSLITLVLVIFLSINYKPIKDTHYSEYCSLLMLSTVGMMLMASTGDLLILYLSLELMSLCIYILTGFVVGSLRSNEASMKYFLLGTFGGMLLLFAIGLIYGVTGTTDIQKIAIYIKEHSLVGNKVLLFAVALAVATFAFKIASVPFHQWSPDVYDGAPTTVTAFMSVAPKAAVFAAFTRVLFEGFTAVKLDWSEFLIIISVLSMAVGNILALTQSNIKRMLAYSSIAHAGYMLIGVIAGNWQAVAIYMIIYAFMNAGAFAVVIALNKGEQLSTFTGLSKSSPFMAFAMLVFMFSLTGIPPTAGFVGKLQLFLPAVKAGYVGLVVVAVIFSIVSAYYYLRVVMLMYMKQPDEIPTTEDTASLRIATALCVLAIAVIGIVPSVLL